VSNSRGKVPFHETKKIITKAAKLNVSLLDTANYYGSSERIIGRALPKTHRFKIVTKTPISKTSTLDNHFINDVKESFENSLNLLNQKSVYGILVHHTKDILKPGGDQLIELLFDYKNQGFVKNIGVSVYNTQEIKMVLKNFTPDIVQLPLNILDQRFLKSGDIASLKMKGVKVHARSLFLQGALLMATKDLPNYFNPVMDRFEAINNTAKDLQLTPLELCLLFGLQTEVDNLITGVTTLNELEMLKSAVSHINTINPINLAKLALNDKAYINPSFWPSFKNSFGSKK
tara:strand:+ start:3088 stop:3951 length:864 start_codon:yes stop_codon:yes gene_type:complete